MDSKLIENVDAVFNFIQNVKDLHRMLYGFEVKFNMGFFLDQNWSVVMRDEHQTILASGSTDEELSTYVGKLKDTLAGDTIDWELMNTMNEEELDDLEFLDDEDAYDDFEEDDYEEDDDDFDDDDFDLDDFDDIDEDDDWEDDDEEDELEDDD